MSAWHGLTLVGGAPVSQLLRQRAFERAHPHSDFPDRPIGGKLLAWVPFESGGVQFSGTTLENLLDQAEEFFDGTESDGPDTG